MKRKLLGSMALALGFSGANLSAATIAFSSSFLVGTPDGASVSTTGTLLEALNFGRVASDTTINTVLFTGFSSGNGAGSNVFANPTADFFSSTSDRASADNYNPPAGFEEYDALLSQFLFSSSTTLNTITLSGLVEGNTYQFQLFEGDTRSLAAASRVRVANGATNTYTTTETFGGNGGSGFVINGEFTADATTQSFTLNKLTAAGGTQEFQLNGYQLREIAVIPEPSIALLGGLGLLALLRRRR